MKRILVYLMAVSLFLHPVSVLAGGKQVLTCDSPYKLVVKKDEPTWWDTIRDTSLIAGTTFVVTQIGTWVWTAGATALTSPATPLAAAGL